MLDGYNKSCYSAGIGTFHRPDVGFVGFPCDLDHNNYVIFL